MNVLLLLSSLSEEVKEGNTSIIQKQMIANQLYWFVFYFHLLLFLFTLHNFNAVYKQEVK